MWNKIGKTYQKSLGEPNQVKGQITPTAMTIHKHLDIDVTSTKLCMKSAIRIMKTHAPPYKVTIMQPKTIICSDRK